MEPMHCPVKRIRGLLYTITKVWSDYIRTSCEEYSSGLLSLIKDFVLSVWEERKVRLYGEHANVHQSHSQNDSGDLRGVAGGDGI